MSNSIGENVQFNREAERTHPMGDSAGPLSSESSRGRATGSHPQATALSVRVYDGFDGSGNG